MKIAVAVVVAALGGAGCKGKDKAAGTAAGSGSGSAAQPPSTTPPVVAPPPPPQGLARVSVRFVDKEVPMQHAFIKRIDPDRYQVYISNGGGSCQELLDDKIPTGRVDVLFTVTPRLNGDGKQYLQITEVLEGAPTMMLDPGATIAIQGAGAKGEVAEVTADFIAQAKENNMQPSRLEVHGTFPAEGCGTRDRDPAGMPRVPHPSNATLTIANQRLELKGAIRRPNGDLVLSTSPKDCSRTTPWATVLLTRTGGKWTLGGTWLEREASDAARLRVQPGAAGRSEDGATVQLALSGAAKLGEFPVVLDGTIEAIDCPP